MNGIKRVNVEVLQIYLCRLLDYRLREERKRLNINKKIDDLEKKLNNINISDIKEQPKPSSGQRRQSSANRQSSFKIPREQIYEVLGEAKKDALQTMHNNWNAFLTRLKGAHAPAH